MSVAEIISGVKQQYATVKEINQTLAEATAQLIREKLELEAKEVSR